MRSITLVAGCLLMRAIGAGTLTPLAAQAVESPPSITLPSALDRVLRDYERGWRAGQPDSVARLFLADGFALPNGKPPARGRDAIVAAYAGPGGDLRLRAFAYATSDSVGYILGAFRYGAGDGDMGKFVLALRRAGDRWMIAADMDNSNGQRRAPGN